MGKILLTGSAGFIGYHLFNKLNLVKNSVIGIDALDEFDIPAQIRSNFLANSIIKQRIELPFLFMEKLEEKPNVVIHLAAETGIKKSLTNQKLYFDTNVGGLLNVLEECKKNNIQHLIYASSSSVYESSSKAMMTEDSKADEQLSFYGTTKRMGEILVQNYCRQNGMIAIGLRFFTVYGSWTRQDMAAYQFMDNLNNNRPITLYNNGNVFRDFTHVSDIVDAMELLLAKIKNEAPGFHQIFNIGNGKPISVKDFAQIIADNLDKPLKYNNFPLPENELTYTHASTEKLFNYIGFRPKMQVEEGIKEMTNWYKQNRYE